MTVLLDRFFIKTGFDRQEIESTPHRGYLYIGIIFMLGMTTAFLIMSLVK